MSSLRIGVLTFHRCINYGSYWQTRCLVEGLKQRGHQAVILDHHSKRVNRAEWKCAFQPVLPTAVPHGDGLLYKQKIRKFLSAFESLPLSASFPLEEPAQMSEYDLVVVGSDEVWNLSHPWFGGSSLFFGDGIRSPKLISYAASFGSYDHTLGLEEEWTRKLQNFDHISVRDENSQYIIKKALGFEPQMVLDPCLQFPVSSAGEDTPYIPKTYIAVYGHNFSQFFIGQVRKYAVAAGLPLISIGYRNDWADEQWLTAGPGEFASFMEQAKGIVTNFFHGCVFALNYSRPFVCEKSAYRSNKLQGLVNKIGCQKHLMDSFSMAVDYQLCLTEPLNPDILKRIAFLKKFSETFLEQALDEQEINVHEKSAQS